VGWRYFHRGDQQITRVELLKKVEEIDGLLCLLSDKIDKELINRAAKLKVISDFAVGYNNVDVDYASRKGIVVTNTPGVLTDATADFTWALLMAVYRRVAEGDRLCREGRFLGWEPMLLLGQDLKHKTLGIMGAGRIGTAVVERSQGWDMSILYFANSRNSFIEENFRARKVALKELLEKSDVVSIHLPLAPETKYLINEETLRIMKNSAVLINTARGSIIDEMALVKALKEKWIAGAGLDVFENEPEITPGLKEFDNVVLAPHIASATLGTRQKMSELAAKNLLAVLEGRVPEFPVNPEVLQG
jgi:glyoxylate reductase